MSNAMTHTEPTPSQRQQIGEFLWVTPNLRPGMKTLTWEVDNKGDWLGVIRWHTGWRQYIFDPASDSIYSAGCLRDLAAFLDKVKTERRSA
jgi:hypothetical protein